MPDLHYFFVDDSAQSVEDAKTWLFELESEVRTTYKTSVFLVNDASNPGKAVPIDMTEFIVLRFNEFSNERPRWMLINQFHTEFDTPADDLVRLNGDVRWKVFLVQFYPRDRRAELAVYNAHSFIPAMRERLLDSKQDNQTEEMGSLILSYDTREQFIRKMDEISNKSVNASPYVTDTYYGENVVAANNAIEIAGSFLSKEEAGAAVRQYLKKATAMPFDNADASLSILLSGQKTDKPGVEIPLIRVRRLEADRNCYEARVNYLFASVKKALTRRNTGARDTDITTELCSHGFSPVFAKRVLKAHADAPGDYNERINAVMESEHTQTGIYNLVRNECFIQNTIARTISIATNEADVERVTIREANLLNSDYRFTNVTLGFV